MKFSLTLLILIITLSSCSYLEKINRTTVPKAQIVYKIDTIPNTEPKEYVLSKYRVKHDVTVKIEKLEEPYIFNLNDSDVVGEIPIDTIDGILFGEEYKLKYYFPENSNKKANLKNEGPKLLYIHQREFALQGITFAFKVRPELNLTQEDSFPKQIVTGINIGFSAGIRKTFYSVRTEKNVFKEKVSRRFSYTIGPFVNFGTTELNKVNTRNSSVLVARNTMLVSTGAFISIGVSKFNLGYGIGFDYAFGPYSDQWVYQGFAHGDAAWLWHGLMISLELK